MDKLKLKLAKIKSSPKFQRIQSFSRQNQYIVVLGFFIVLLLLSGALIAARNFTGIAQNTPTNKIEATPTPTPTPTEEPTPVATPSFAPTVSKTPTKSPTATPSPTVTPTPVPTTAKIIVRYLHDGTNEPLQNPTHTGASVNGPMSSNQSGNSPEYTFPDLTPGEYTVSVKRPAGYSLVESGCDGSSCQNIGSHANDCDVKFTMNKGDTWRVVCKYKEGNLWGDGNWD